MQDKNGLNMIGSHLMTTYYRKNTAELVT